jgi:hypothetical protein
MPLYLLSYIHTKLALREIIKWLFFNWPVQLTLQRIKNQIHLIQRTKPLDWQSLFKTLNRNLVLVRQNTSSRTVVVSNAEPE